MIVDREKQWPLKRVMSGCGLAAIAEAIREAPPGCVIDSIGVCEEPKYFLTISYPKADPAAEPAAPPAVAEGVVEPRRRWTKTEEDQMVAARDKYMATFGRRSLDRVEGFSNGWLEAFLCYAAPRPAAPVTAEMVEGIIEASADKLALWVAELPDRTSPADWPEAMLVTTDELRFLCGEAIRAALTAALAAQQAGGQS